uniref:uncharacterized protein LOC120326575 n=1 Tax=Styela clava TaxID=7725 RepID=UPI0019395FDB|nr:uncharacterized protein LOC120326575 [Styela clava]
MTEGISQEVSTTYENTSRNGAFELENSTQSRCKNDNTKQTEIAASVVLGILLAIAIMIILIQLFRLYRINRKISEYHKLSDTGAENRKKDIGDGEVDNQDQDEVEYDEVEFEQESEMEPVYNVASKPKTSE